MRCCCPSRYEEFWPGGDGDDDEEATGGEGGEGGEAERAKLAAMKLAAERVLTAHDLFDVLSLPRECSAADVQKAYVKLSKDVHPDKNRSQKATPAFHRLAEAKETLADDRARAEYAAAHPPKPDVARDWARAMERQAKKREAKEVRQAAQGARAWAKEMEAAQPSTAPAS